MKQSPSDIVLVEGDNELNVQMAPARIGSFTLFGTGFHSLATRWRVGSYGDGGYDQRYLYTWRSISKSFEIIDADLDNCRMRVTQRRDGIVKWDWYGPFSGLVDGGTHTLNLETGEME